MGSENGHTKWDGTFEEQKKTYYFINLLLLAYVMDRANINEIISFNYE